MVHIKKILREHLSFEPSSLYVPKELVSARVKTDLVAIERVVDLSTRECVQESMVQRQ